MAVEAAGNLRRVLSTPALRRNAAVSLRGVDEAGLTSLIDAVSFGEAPRELAPELPVQLAQSAAEFVQIARTLQNSASVLTRPGQSVFEMRSVRAGDGEMISGTAATGAELGDFTLAIERLAVGQ